MMINFEYHHDQSSDDAQSAIPPAQPLEHVTPQWPISFGCTPPGTYLDPTDQRQFRLLLIPVQQWSTYVGWQISKLEWQLRDTCRMGPHNEKWLQEHNKIRLQLDHLLDDMQQVVQYTGVLRNAMMRHDYDSRLIALNTRIQGVHRQAAKEGLDPRSAKKIVSLADESRRLKPAQTCQAWWPRKRSPSLVIGQDSEDRGEASQNDSQDLSILDGDSEPAELNGQLALQKTQLRRAKWEQSRSKNLMVPTNKEHHGKKKPKKGKFKRKQSAIHPLSRLKLRSPVLMQKSAKQRKMKSGV
jgi:hypothetical protein